MNKAVDAISVKLKCKNGSINIEGINIEQAEGLSVVFIEDFNRGLQDIIRSQLAGIFHGFAEVEELPQFYSYPDTLKSFLDRYQSKSENIKKGMIGELLAHVLINALFDDLISLSILKNKEERNIKKGFDIIYYRQGSRDLWYTEVKSGRSEDGKATSDAYNLELLARSKESILEMFRSRRSSLWESAIIDVKLTVEEGSRRKNMRELLTYDTPNEHNANDKKNVILVSVLYHAISDKMTLKDIIEFHSKVLGEQLFNNTIIFSIQKETYEKVALFLEAESHSR